MENICAVLVSIQEPAVLFPFLQVTFVTLPAVATSAARQRPAAGRSSGPSSFSALVKLLFFNVIRFQQAGNTFDLFQVARL